MNNSYNKPPIDPVSQIALLKQKGLSIVDEESALEFLHNVSYYRLGWYFKAFQESDNHFKKDTDFADIQTAYITDQRLRILIIEAIERIEVSIRARIVNITCCDTQDPFWHIQSEQIQEIVNKRMPKQLQEKNTNCPFNHYNKNYTHGDNKDHHYPFWIVSELFFFSDLSVIYKQGIAREHKKTIAKSFHLNSYQLASCLHMLTVLRNSVAHHDKVFKRVFAISPPKKFEWILAENIPFKRHNFFINHYYVICYLLSIIHPYNSWQQRVNKLLFADPSIAFAYGFTFDDIAKLSQ